MSILITGTNTGFGKLAALSLAREGKKVIATMRDPNKGDDIRRVANEEGLSIEIRELDVCNLEMVQNCLADAQEIEAIVNNAGFEIQAAVEQLEDDLMWKQLDTNLLGPLRLIRTVLPVWTQRGSGVIVNVSSIAGRSAPPYSGSYAASKHALEALSESLHFEVSHLGIRVCVIEPGRFSTGFFENIVRPDTWEGSQHQERAMAFREALMRLDNISDNESEESAGPPDPQEVADAIVRAVSDSKTPFRTLVGQDAELIDATKTSMSFEDFETTMRTALDWHD
ncbi:MAG: short-chain dehydrogenase/reductase [Acidimicrobiaceae bacterium]|nr:short-chain dehydrogenase/reductase [Acidimicrobiaceae bacterium]MAR49407.1 short-chain dehydrogenase/reductase [Acidimicrobiaceae bacterium]MBD26969.1 short-chain dehydrogenase/reductase [Acidimicrobiaceae bacterium]|tara:strand:+ start:1675 stop:2520 length:846 start_codon:yes stop_codon:yes gene_type:complete